MAHASPTSAPGRLDLVRRFVNTSDIEVGTDTLETPEALADWLGTAGLLVGTRIAGRSDLESARNLRESFRDALAANHAGQRMTATSVDALNAAARDAGLYPVLTSEARWTSMPTASGVAGALGSLLVVVMDAMADGSWRRLKVCVNDACRWAFYDHSRARSGKWCSMEVCGNRAKQQAWRQRHVRA
ncbi:MAG: CGNR zinc finger domain-containing protein [Jiangellaceae bacterium]